MVYRIYVEKKPQFAVDGGAVLADLNVALGIKTVENVRIINRYDCEKLPKENFEAAVPTVFSEASGRRGILRGSRSPAC